MTKTFPANLKNENKKLIDLDNYFPFLITTISGFIAQGTHYEEYNGYKIGIREWRVISLIAHKGTLSAKQISTTSGMDKATVSRAINRLVADGLIQRQQYDHDRRRQTLKLTDEGMKLYSIIAEQKLNREKRMRKILTQQEYEQLLKLLKKVRRGVIEELGIDAE